MQNGNKDRTKHGTGTLSNRLRNRQGGAVESGKGETQRGGGQLWKGRNRGEKGGGGGEGGGGGGGWGGGGGEGGGGGMWGVEAEANAGGWNRGWWKGV